MAIPMKAMQGGMSMVGEMDAYGAMQDAKPPQGRHDGMLRRMDMMERMMRMMMDLEQVTVPASR